MSFWNEQREESLKELVAGGITGSQIASDLGTTRNAVIGKISRMGLVRPPRQYQPRVKRKQSSADHSLKVRVAFTKIAIPPVQEPVYSDLQKCSLMELNEHTCRWPVGNPGDPGFFFCGATPVDELPYCAYHSRIAYSPASERKKAA